METKTSPPWPAILLMAACALAFVARLFPWSLVFQDGQVFFFADDCHYHMRRIQLIIAHFPRAAMLDSYVNYPEGAYCIWPPLFDFFIALLALAAGLGHPSQRLIEVLAAFVPPALGALTLLPVFLIARSLAGPAVGILAAFLLAIMPGHVRYSVLGRVDHHVAEAFLLACAWWFFSSAFSALAGASAKRFLLAGLFLGALFLAQCASAVYAAPLFLCVVAQCVTCADADAASEKARHAGLAFALAALMILPFAATAPVKASSDTPFLGLSGFHAAILAGACSFPGIVSGLARAGVWGGWRRLLNLLIAGVMTALGLLVVMVLFPQLSGALRAGMEFFFRKEAMARMIVESKPLFSIQAGSSRHGVADLLLSWAFYLVPVVLVWMFLARPPGEHRFTPPRTFFLVATLYFGAMTLFQQRFAYIFAMNVSIAFAYLIVGIARKAGPALSPSFPRLVGGAAAACAFLLLAEPVAQYFFNVPTGERYYALSPPVYRGLQWLRDNTPPTSFYDDPQRRPEYAVLCEWDKGHALEYIAHRPVVVNNFGAYMSRQGFIDSIRFFLTESEAEAVEIAQRRGVRFVVTTPLRPDMYPSYCTLLGLNPSRYIGSNPKSGEMWSLKLNSYKLVGPHLHETDGRAILDSESGHSVLAHRLERFRLVYEAPSGSPEFSGANSIPLKIFEFVRSARLSGKGIPNKGVSAHAFLKTNTGRRFEYMALGQCGPDGAFSILIPYPTRNSSCPVRTEGDFDVACGALSGRAAIDETAVERGDAVSVVLSTSSAAK